MKIQKGKEYRNREIKKEEYTRYQVCFLGFTFEIVHDSKNNLIGLKNLIMFWVFVVFMLLLTAIGIWGFMFAFKLQNFA